MIHDVKKHYYSVESNFISGLEFVEVYESDGASVPYPYLIKVGEGMAALSVEGVKELIEALVKVL